MSPAAARPVARAAADVTYATLHVVGSNNNLGDVDPDPAEWAARDAATNEWLRQTFDKAEAKRSDGVMLIIQANPGFDMADPARAPTRDPRTLLPEDRFFNFLPELRREVIEFDKPVVLVHGDSHYFRVDKPVLDRNGNRIEHFTRVEQRPERVERRPVGQGHGELLEPAGLRLRTGSHSGEPRPLRSL